MPTQTLTRLQVDYLTCMHDQVTALWHRPAISQPRTPANPRDLLQLAIHHHRANFDLWHQEDDARNPEAPDSTIADVKHRIDSLNQLRNDLVEQMDAHLLELVGPQSAAAPLHSETPGLILDRLSILALKIYHTAEESERPSASAEHRAKSLTRLAVLSQQRDDLALCLQALWKDILEGRRRFKLYRQMKMYNDPELNPVLYRKAVCP